MIEVFRTNVATKRVAGRISRELMLLYPSARIDFDLGDDDRVLRVEYSGAVLPEDVVSVLSGAGYTCTVMD